LRGSDTFAEGAVEFAEAAVGGRGVAFERHDALMDGIEDLTDLGEEFAFQFGSGADPVVSTDDSRRCVEVI